MVYFGMGLALGVVLNAGIVWWSYQYCSSTKPYMIFSVMYTIGDSKCYLIALMVDHCIT